MSAMFGPVMWFDLIRSTRHRRFFWLRWLFLGVLLFGFNMLASHYHHSPSADETERTAAADLARTYFEGFMVLQFAAVVLLTPAFIAGTIAAEKDRRTIEYLFATDLHNHEIVLGLFGSRLAHLALLFLTGLPIVALLQFLGGIDPNLVLAGFAATALTLFGLGGVALCLSVLCRKPRDAIALTYLVAATYILLSVVGQEALAALGGASASGAALGLAGLLRAFNSGNIFLALLQVQEAGKEGTLDTMLPGLLGRYALFHGLLGAVACSYAVLRLRTVALQQANTPPQSRSIRLRSAPGDQPMVWKETVAEGGLRLPWIGQLVLGFLVLVSFLAVPIILYYQQVLANSRSALVGPFGEPWGTPSQAVNGWVRLVGAGVGSLALVAVAIRAATSLSGERERQTLDGLVASPLTSGEILWAKWLGSLWSVRWVGWWMSAAWALAWLMGGLHLAAVAMLIVAWLVYAASLALLGLWFSLICATSSRAVLATLGTTFVLCFGHWFLWVCCLGGMGSGIVGDLALIQAGWTPPAALWWLSFAGSGFDHGPLGYGPLEKYAASPFVGVCFWAIIAFVLSTHVRERFVRLTNRGISLAAEQRFNPQGLLLDLSTFAKELPAPKPHSPKPATPTPKPPPTLRGARVVEESSGPVPPPTRLRGAKLIEETPARPPEPPLLGPRGAKLIQESWEPPTPRPPESG